MFLKEAQRHIAGSDKLVLCGFQAECPAEFLHIVLSAAGGIVGNIVGFSAFLLDKLKQFCAAVIQSVAYGKGSVYVEEEELFLL